MAFLDKNNVILPHPGNRNLHSFMIHVDKARDQHTPFHTTYGDNHGETNSRITKSRKECHEKPETNKQHYLNIHYPYANRLKIMALQ